MQGTSQTAASLLPCPFCGGEAEIIHNSIGLFVGCFNEDCPVSPSTGTFVDGYATEAEAIEAWNTRHENCCPKPCNPACWKVATDDN